MKRNPTLAERILRARVERAKPDNTLRAAAEAMKVSHAIVARWEKGDVIPQQRHVPAIADYLGLEVATVARLRDQAMGS
jgi:transcriptional regulator with XRE-family HTH domain